MPRIADDILIGGMRLYLVEENNGEKEYYDLGWMSGEFKMEEQADSTAIKESEGSTVLNLATNKEAHFTFSMLECNLQTLLKLNPSAVEIGGTGDTTADGKGFAVGTYQSDKTFTFEAWLKKRSGKYLCVRIYKGKVSGNLTTLLLNQDSESPIDIDIVALGDDSKNTNHNLYEEFECEATKAPNGGW